MTIERASQLTDQDVVDINNLIKALSSRSNVTVDKQLLQRIITSKSHVLLIARLANKIVGMATVSLLFGPAAGCKTYLDDFVVDPSVRGKDIGSRLWEEMLAWGREHGATKMEFTSRPEREAAQQFYHKKGATVRATNAFVKQL